MYDGVYMHKHDYVNMCADTYDYAYVYVCIK